MDNETMRGCESFKDRSVCIGYVHGKCPACDCYAWVDPVRQAARRAVRSIEQIVGGTFNDFRDSVRRAQSSLARFSSVVSKHYPEK